MKVTLVTILLAAVVAVGQTMAAKGLIARDVSVGICPTFSNKEDLDPVPYLGPWYEIERFELAPEKDMDCVKAVYSDLGDGLVEVHNMARSNGFFTEIYGTATVIEPGVLLVEFPGSVPSEYHVLDTDYTTFSAVYNCEQVEEMRFQYAWILSRTPTMDQETYDYARQVFVDNGIDVTIFQPTYQGDDCPYVE